MTTGRDSDKFMLRLPDGMRERVRSAAQRNGRSMNAEIVATLDKKYPAPAKGSRLLEEIKKIQDQFVEKDAEHYEELSRLIQEFEDERDQDS